MKDGQEQAARQGRLQHKSTSRTLSLLPFAVMTASLTLPVFCSAETLPSIENTVTIDELVVDDSSANYFGPATGYVHPFISIEGMYSDNIYNARDNETDDFVFTTSPGIWVAAPGTRDIVLNLNPSNTSPGGLGAELQRGEIQRKFQSYALYEADISTYSSESQNDITDHTAEGMLRYDFSGGLGVELIDKYIRSHDEFNSDGSRDGDLQKYDSNIVMLSLSYIFSPKTRMEGRYANFYLDYDQDERSYRDRTDNAYTLYFYYDYSPKTSLFLNGEYTTSDFDTATENDADQYNIYTGIQWRYSTKTDLRMRLGYVNRSLDSGIYDDASEFAGDILMRYRFSEKTSLNLLAASNVEIPDNDDYSYLRRNFLRLSYRQDITPKIRVIIDGDLGYRDYMEGSQDDRNDDYYRLAPSIQYTFKEWMMAALGYSYTNRDSNYDFNDYSTNEVFLKLTFSL